MASPFDAFLAQCWADHAEHPADVARRLDSSEISPPDSAALAALLRLELHVRAEHLGDFDAARASLHRWARDPLADDAVRSALRVGRHSLALADRALAREAFDALDDADRAACQATLDALPALLP